MQVACEQVLICCGRSKVDEQSCERPFSEGSELVGAWNEK